MLRLNGALTVTESFFGVVAGACWAKACPNPQNAAKKNTPIKNL